MSESMTESDAIKALGQLLTAAGKETAQAKGACVYVAGTKTYCAVLTKSECDVLKGNWVSGGKCP